VGFVLYEVLSWIAMIARHLEVWEMSKSFTGELEFVSEGGTLFRDLKDSPLVTIINIVNL
jgi:hypothetical protein